MRGDKLCEAGWPKIASLTLSPAYNSLGGAFVALLLGAPPNPPLAPAAQVRLRSRDCKFIHFVAHRAHQRTIIWLPPLSCAALSAACASRMRREKETPFDLRSPAMPSEAVGATVTLPSR